MVVLEAKRAFERMTCSHEYEEEYCPTAFEKDFNTVAKTLEEAENILNSPFIIDNLAELGKLPPEAKKRYLFGTITNSEVEKVEEFFKNGEK